MTTWRAVPVLVVLLALAGTARSATYDQIEKAIERGKTWLYAQQSSNGNWETDPKRDPDAKAWRVNGGQWGGRTALATAALLVAGEKPEHPAIASAIDFLKKARIEGVYALSMRCVVWSRLPQTPDVAEALARDANLLVKMTKSTGDAKGFADYLFTGDADYSHSRGNYAALGVWSAAQAGIEVSPSYWRMIQEGWRSHQLPDGSWTYQQQKRTKYPSTPGMTAAGIATLFIAEDYLGADAADDCKPSPPNPSLEKGIKWLAANLDKVATDESYERDWPFPTLYAVERVGVASGMRYIGGVDWYQKGADWLIDGQRKDGAWSHNRKPDLIDTCFAVLFLARGRAPLAIAKVDYSASGASRAWNNRPRDVANVVRWLSRVAEHDLSWQSVTLDAPVEDLIESPVLYLSGSEQLTLSAQHKERIKQYVEAGGLVLASADCGKAPFASSMKKLGKELFPKYNFRDLPDSSSIFSTYSRSKWRMKPVISAMSNGVRELIVLVPTGDASRSWQANVHKDRPELFQLAANVYFYAVDRSPPRDRGQGHFAELDDADVSSTLLVARLKYDGNWDPEPGGWRRLSAIYAKEHSTSIEVRAVELDGSGGLSQYKFAHLTGTEELKLSSQQLEEIRSWISSGGTLIVDAAGGSTRFADSAAKVLVSLFDGRTVAPLAKDHSIYNSPTPVEFEYRSYARKFSNGQLDGPKLIGIEIDGRLAVVFSREDLSAGLVGQRVDGVMGYTPHSATMLMSRILMHSAQQ